MQRIKDYLQLVKLSLSIMVVFSSVISFMLTQGFEEYEDKWWRILLLFAGGMLVTGSANAINQTVEKDTDAMMKRTGKRPIASGRMSVEHGWAFAILTGALGVFMGGWILFGIQFLWQFPHFWAIAWVAHTDYSTAGFKLLPADKGPTKFTALQTVIYSLLLMPVTLLPYFTGMCSYDDVKGIISVVLVLAANVFMLMRCIRLYQKMDVSSARKVMFGSYMYLPVVLLALLMSKI